MGVPQMTVEGTVLEVPEFKTTPRGLPVLKLKLLATTRFEDREGVWHDGALYKTTATAFKDLALNIRTSIHKGDRVICSGRIETEEWADALGNRKSVDKFVLNDCGPSLKMARRRHEHVVRAETEAAMRAEFEALVAAEVEARMRAG